MNNIIAHIEAGHYERDEDGRALVPTRAGKKVIIYATDCPSEDNYPIVGFDGDSVETWKANGSYTGGHESSLDLMPPAADRAMERGSALVLAIRREYCEAARAEDDMLMDFYQWEPV